MNPPEPAGRGSRGRRIVGIGCLVSIVLLLGFVSMLNGVHWDSGFRRARYDFLITDPAGRPVEGVELRVLGQTRECWEEGLTGGRWPVYEAGGEPLLTDAAGELVVHQPEYGLQYGGYSYDLFWIVPMGYPGPNVECEFHKAGYQVLRIPFKELDAPARERHSNWNQARIVTGPGGHDYPAVEVALVMVPESE